jgi:hypothetical protein
VQKDGGMYDAVVRGISRSTASIIGHLNSDEQYLQGALKSVKEFFDTRSSVEVLFGDAILIDADGRPLSCNHSGWLNVGFTIEKSIRTPMKRYGHRTAMLVVPR